jgi:hypothetical protein
MRYEVEDCCGLRLERLPKFLDPLCGVDRDQAAKFLRGHGVSRKYDGELLSGVV